MKYLCGYNVKAPGGGRLFFCENATARMAKRDSVAVMPRGFKFRVRVLGKGFVVSRLRQVTG